MQLSVSDCSQDFIFVAFIFEYRTQKFRGSDSSGDDVMKVTEQLLWADLWAS